MQASNFFFFFFFESTCLRVLLSFYKLGFEASLSSHLNPQNTRGHFTKQTLNVYADVYADKIERTADIYERIYVKHIKGVWSIDAIYTFNVHIQCVQLNTLNLYAGKEISMPTVFSLRK